MSTAPSCSTGGLSALRKASGVLSACSQSVMCKHAENRGLVRAKTATPRKGSKGKNKIHENLKRAKPEVALKLFPDDSTVKNEYCTSEIVPVLDGTETATPREHRTEATHEMDPQHDGQIMHKQTGLPYSQ